MKDKLNNILIISKRNSTAYFALKAINEKKNITFLNDVIKTRTYGNFDLPVIVNDGFLEQKTFPLHVISGSKRFDFYGGWFRNELNREFSFYKRNINNFLEELSLINKKTNFLFENESSFCPLKLKDYYNVYFKKISLTNYLNKNINSLYKKHSLPTSFINSLNAVLFLFSGIWSEKYPLIFASRIITNALEGLYKASDSFSVREFLITKIKNKVKYLKLNSGFNFTKKDKKIELSSSDLEQVVHFDSLIIDEVIEDNNDFDKIYTHVVDYKINKDLISNFINDDILFIDSDKSSWFDYKNLYYIQKLKIDDKYFVVRVVNFSDKKSKTKDLKLEEILLRLFPSLNIKDLEFLDQDKDNFDDVNYIKQNKKLKKWACSKFKKNLVKIGRKNIPFLGYNAYNKTALKAFLYLFGSKIDD